MSGDKLPLWNKDETDVLPDYQLSYGHIVCQAIKTAADVRLLGKYLDIGATVYSGDFDVDRLPIEPTSGCHVLGTEQEAQLLVAEVGRHFVVFGPHKLFRTSGRWIDWNSSIGGLMAYVRRLDVDEYFYIIFSKGKRLFDAVAEGGSYRYIEDTPIEVQMDGERIYHDPGGKPQVTDEIEALLAGDARIIEENGVITIKRFPSNQRVERVTHYIFQKSRRRWFSLSR